MENPKKRLGFREIVPGSDATVPTSPSSPEVPQLDLGQQLMANHRKLVAATRRRPGQKDQASGQAGSQSAVGPVASERIWRPVMTEPQHQVIAQIVARDIERLCRGERVFG